MSAIQQNKYCQFLVEIKERIRTAQYEAMKAVNKEMIALYWDIGKRITDKQQQLGWGKAIVETLSKDLQNQFPGIRGFGTSNLWAMAQFFSEYEGSTILRPLVGEISWSKHLVIMTFVLFLLNLELPLHSSEINILLK